MPKLTTIADFEVGAAWPPKQERERLEQYQRNHLLFTNRHHEVLGESSSVLRPELKAAQHFVLNVYKRLSTHWADMVWGEAPSIATSDDAQAQLSAILENNDLQEVSYRMALDKSVYGNAVYKVRLENGQAILEGQPPQYWFPILDPSNINREDYHVLAWDYETLERVNGQQITQRWLRLEIHERGLVTYRLHTMNGNSIGALVEESSEVTGVDAFLVVPVHGLRTTETYYGADDYVDLDSLVLELEDRLAQMSKILDKHAEPGMHGPASALEYDAHHQQWQFKRNGYLVRDSNDDPVPGYLTWDGNLEAAIAEFNLVFEQLLFVAETSPAAFGIMRQGMAESGSALRRLMMQDIKKSNRNRMSFDRALRWALYVAASLQFGQGLELQIDWRDGLPEDVQENSLVAERGVKFGFISKETAIRSMHPDWDDDAVTAELDRIAEDQGAEAATLTAGMPSAGISFGGEAS